MKENSSKSSSRVGLGHDTLLKDLLTVGNSLFILLSACIDLWRLLSGQDWTLIVEEDQLNTLVSSPGAFMSPVSSVFLTVVTVSIGLKKVYRVRSSILQY